MMIEENYFLKDKQPKFFLAENVSGIAHVKTEGIKQRIDELSAFIQESPKELIEYDESMVRKYIEQIKVYEWKFTVCFKTKVEIEISR